MSQAEENDIQAEVEEGEEVNPNPEGEEGEEGEPKPDPNAERNEFHAKLKEGLSQVAKTHDNSSYAYIKLNMAEKEVKGFFRLIENYPHLRYINFSTNEIENLESLEHAAYALKIDLSSNQISDLSIFTNQNHFMYLQILNLQGNKVQKIPAIHLPRLKVLNLAENEITSYEEFIGLTGLEYLDLRKNKLKNCDNLEKLDCLIELDLSENQISNFQGLKDMKDLKTLNLRGNKLKKMRLPLPELPSLKSLDISENEIGKWSEIMKFRYYLTLEEVNAASNPVSDEVGDLKKEILMNFPHYTKINEEDITEDDVNEALEELAERKREEEEKRRQEEEERLEAERAEREAEEERKRLEEEERRELEAQLEEQKKAEEEQTRKLKEAQEQQAKEEGQELEQPEETGGDGANIEQDGEEGGGEEDD